MNITLTQAKEMREILLKKSPETLEYWRSVLYKNNNNNNKEENNSK